MSTSGVYDAQIIILFYEISVRTGDVGYWKNIKMILYPNPTSKYNLISSKWQ